MGQLEQRLEQAQLAVQQALASCPIAAELEGLLGALEEEQQAQSTLELLRRLEDCSRVEVSHQLDSEPSLERQCSLAVVVQECSKSLPPDMRRARENSELLVAEARNRVTLALKEAILQSDPQRIEQVYRSALKLGL